MVLATGGKPWEPSRMCNAYELGKRRGGSVPQHLGGAIVEKLSGIVSTRLIRRTDPAPVVTVEGGLRTMRWGFARPGLGDINNARSDKLTGPMWGEAFRDRRCLVPVAAFYEWSGPKGNKRTHRFTRPDGGWLWMAGIWEENASHGPCFSMITTAANALVAPIHERMPAVLGDSELADYLAGEVTAFAPKADTLEVAATSG